MIPKIFSGSAEAQIGFKGNAAKEVMPTATIGVTGKAEYKGFYTQANAGIGSAVIYGAEVGKNIPLKNDFEIKTSVGVDKTVLTHERNYFASVSDVGGNKGPSWKSNDLRTHGNVQVTLKKPWGEIGVGVEAGVKQAKQPELGPGTIDPSIGETRGTEFAGTTRKSYATPTFNSKINLGKNFSFDFDASSQGGKFGISYNF